MPDLTSDQAGVAITFFQPSTMDGTSCAKQVERRMLVHTFQYLMVAGFPISDYKYTGLGSIYFIDFIIFHRYLGIKRFLSVEKSQDITKRIKFNKPFKCVDIAFGNIVDYLPGLSRDIKHILWLDFDDILSEDILGTIYIAASQLSSGSILIVTVDVEPPGRPEEGRNKWNPKSWMDYFIQEAHEYVWLNPKVTDFTRNHLPSVNARLINNAINRGTVSRIEVSFYPLFNFIYADGHKMLSVGGMIGTEADGRKLKNLDLETLFFLRKSLICDPYEIIVPKVTRKERLYLDSYMPCPDNWTPIDFELSREHVDAYKKIYKYYPAYTEMFL